jgi:hypothetical protein
VIYLYLENFQEWLSGSRTPTATPEEAVAR